MDRKIFLLADDDRDDTEMFMEAITGIDSSIICHCTSDGREALLKLDELTEKPDLIFLDVNMPAMNGWQCLQILKADERYKKIPVVIISTSSHQRDINTAAELGTLCYFIKPNDFNELTQILQVMVASLGVGLADALRNAPGNVAKYIHACGESSKQK